MSNKENHINIEERSISGMEVKKICVGWIVEDTEEKALQVLRDSVISGKVTYYDVPEKCLAGHGRKTKQPIYKYRIHCYR